MRNASQQYIGATIAHELLHVYFENAYTGPFDVEHNTMVNFIDDMAQTIRLSFPTISPEDAKALALGGLNNNYIVAWNAGLTQEQRNNILEINQNYKNGTKGNKCP